MLAVGQTHLFFHGTGLHQAGPELPAHPDNEAPITGQSLDQARHRGLRKPKTPNRRALYRPREPRREFGVKPVPKNPHARKIKLARRLGEEGRLPFPGLHQRHPSVGMKRRQHETGKPRAATHIEKAGLTVLRMF